MNHKEVAKLHELVEGDVFYLLGVKKPTKMVLYKLEGKRNTSKLGYTYTATIREQAHHIKMLDPGKPGNADKVKKEAENIEVVFLRHKEAIA